MNNSPVVWFEIYVEDMQRARTFYEGVLGLSLDRLPIPDIEMWRFPQNLDNTGASGSLVHMPGVPSGGNSTLVYFHCDNCAVEESRVAEHGGKVERGKMSIGEYGFVALVTDTEGNRIGLHSEN